MARKQLTTKELQASMQKRKEYKRDYQKKRRLRLKEITVPCPKQQFKALKQRAKKFQRTVGTYLLEFETAYHQGMRLDPNPKATSAIARDLLMIRMLLEDLLEESEDNKEFQAGLKVLVSIQSLLEQLLDFHTL